MGKVIEGRWRKPAKREISPTRKQSAFQKDKVYQLRVALADSDPEIWRRILVPGNTPLSRLHRIIQELMLWEDYHLHEFVVNGVRYTVPDPEEMEPYKDEKRYYLYSVAPEEGITFFYVYDYGDDWVHNIEVEKILDGDERFTGKPVCIDGQLSGPPEDSGGVFGYGEMLKVVRNKQHPEHKEIKQWLGKFDPREFDIIRINRELEKIK